VVLRVIRHHHPAVSGPAQHAPKTDDTARDCSLAGKSKTLVNHVLVFSSCFHMRRKFPWKVCMQEDIYMRNGTNRNVLGIKSVGIGMNQTGASSRVAAP